MCMWNIYRIKTDQDSTWMAKVLGLRKELLLSLPKAQLFKAHLVSANPSCSPSQCPLQPSLAVELLNRMDTRTHVRAKFSRICAKQAVFHIFGTI